MTSTQGPTLTDARIDESDVFVLGIRESTADEAWSLVLFEAEEGIDEQDRDLDLDSYCLVTEPGQATTYGGVRECELSREMLRLQLSEEAAEILGMPIDTTFRLDLDAVMWTDLRRGLQRVLSSGSTENRPHLIGFQPEGPNAAMS